MKRLDEVPAAVRHQRLHGSHHSFLDLEEARSVTADLTKGTRGAGTSEELVEQVRNLGDEASTRAGGGRPARPRGIIRSSVEGRGPLCRCAGAAA